MGTKRKGQPDKKHAPRTLVATAANKELFIEQLATGIAPGDAAEAINIDRSTAYAWKKDDGLFSARWDNAVETSLDKLETVLYNAAKSGDINAIMNTLKYRRKHVYSNNTSDADRLSGSQTNFPQRDSQRTIRAPRTSRSAGAGDRERQRRGLCFRRRSESFMRM